MSLRITLLLTAILVWSPSVVAQESADNADVSAPLKTVSTTQPSDSSGKSDLDAKSAKAAASATAEPPPAKQFKLPAAQHAWSRFKPGAWREIQTITKTLNDRGEVATQNLTIHKETLEAVADGKYVLKVQATVVMGGKRIVGETTTRVLHLDTDVAGPPSETHRLEDRPLTLPGHAIECEIWDVHYQEGNRNLRDLIYYNAERFPYVLHRETYVVRGRPSVDNSQPAAQPKNQPKNQPNTQSNNQPNGQQRDSTAAPDLETGAPSNSDTKGNSDTKATSEVVGKAQQTTPPAEASQIAEVVAFQVPCVFDEQLIGCVCQRVFRHRAKGDSVRLSFSSERFPGGEVSVRSTDFDAHGQPIRLSVTTLLGFGGEPIEAEIAPEQPSQP